MASPPACLTPRGCHADRFYGLYSTRKYVEQFSNGIVICAFYLRCLKDAAAAGAAGAAGDIRHRIARVVSDASLHFVLPQTSLTPLLRQGRLSSRQVCYAYAAWKFAFHFLNRHPGTPACVRACSLGARALTLLPLLPSRPAEDFGAIQRAVERSDPVALSELFKMTRALQTQTYPEGLILDVIVANTDVVALLYDHFARLHDPRSDRARGDR